MTTPTIAPSQLSQNIAKSMTIEQMRKLHQRALSEAEAKRTELRLVLASRYRELVGSSDEVIKMKERSQELHDLVRALPHLMEKLSNDCTPLTEEAKESSVDTDRVEDESALEKMTTDLPSLLLRRDLSRLPLLIHRAMDAKDVHKASVSLIQLFTLIASQTDLYPLANSLSLACPSAQNPDIDPALEVQMRLTFLQMQTLPGKIRRISTKILIRAASYGVVTESGRGAITSAAALASMNLIETDKDGNRAEQLLNVYFESKAKLLVSLLGKLTTDEGFTASNTTAEEILSKIVLILQHDVIVHPYQIFVIRKFPGDNGDEIMIKLPLFEKEMVKAKCSK